MKLAIIATRANVGIEALAVTVEAHISGGLPAFSIVGLPEAAVKESKDRVRSALLTSNFEFSARRLTINLAPAALPKAGSGFDLPIALGILAASRQIPTNSLQHYEFVGELALSGDLRPLPGILPIALACKRAQRKLILPMANATEAALVPGIEIYAANNLLEVCAHLCNRTPLPLMTHQPATPTITHKVDLADVKGQYHAKRALEIAAAGGHSMLMVGPPGTGKTMLAMRLATILPPLPVELALESAAIRSLHGMNRDVASWQQRPFRAPHHTASSVALVGGGRPPKPGEISLAHHGVLFLDELPEFNRQVLETLREPLESGMIAISRAAHQAEFPARFQLIAAMNPCPCGNLGNPYEACRCSSLQIQRYLHRLSGPLLDRLDLHLEVPALKQEVLLDHDGLQQETSATVRERVIKAQHLQFQRQGYCNHQLSVKDLAQFCRVAAAEQQLLQQAITSLKLSSRAYHRVLRISRTIADLAASSDITQAHLAEALSYRGLKYLQQ